MVVLDSSITYHCRDDVAAADAAVLVSPRNFNGCQVPVNRGVELVETGAQQRVFQ